MTTGENYLLERIKEILEAMIEGERDQYIQERGGRRNGCWRRSLETELGIIQQLRVAKVREGGFYSSVLQLYARRVVELDKLIITFLRSKGFNEKNLSNFAPLLRKRSIGCADLRSHRAGSREAAAEVFPSAAFQLRWLHKAKNLLAKVRARDRAALAYDLKLIYKAENLRAAREAFTLFKLAWSRKYPKVVESLEKDLSSLLSFMEAPPQVWDKLYTTNLLERAIKEIRRRTKTIESFPTPEALEKLVYLVIYQLNESWGRRRLKGFTVWQMQRERKEKILTQTS